MSPPNPPWEIHYADGSGNVTRLWQTVGSAPRWRYAPVTPATSSSGTYSGGTPGSGDCDEASCEALWTHAWSLASGPCLPEGDRRKGTGAFRLTTAEGERSFLVDRGEALSRFDALVGALVGRR